MLIPTYLQKYAKNAQLLDEVITQFDIVATNGKEDFLIYYYGEIMQGSDGLIVATDFSRNW